MLFLMKAIIVKSLDICLTLNCFLKVTLGFFSFNVLCATAKLLQSCPTLCDLRDGSPPGSAIPGILQARILEWKKKKKKNTGVGCHFLLQSMSESEVAQSCLTPSYPMDRSLPGSSVHGIFQAAVLEWVAMAFSEYIM